MSEIKTSCTVCSQHITLDSAWIGKEVVCPTCQSQFSVPPTYPPLISSAVPPRLPVSPPVLPGVTRPATRRSSGYAWIAIGGAALLAVVFIGVAVAGLFAVRKMKLQDQRQAQILPPQPGSARRSNLRLHSANITNVNIQGTLCGAPVRLTSGNMTTHAITLSDGTGAKQREILLFLFLNGASPEGRNWTLPGPWNQQQTKPHVHLRCPSASASGVLGPDYRMHLVFENESEGRIPALIELNAPSKGVSLKGSFELITDKAP